MLKRKEKRKKNNWKTNKLLYQSQYCSQKRTQTKGNSLLLNAFCRFLENEFGKERPCCTKYPSNPKSCAQIWGFFQIEGIPPPPPLITANGVSVFVLSACVWASRCAVEI
jgi:hypothetical protein